MTSKLRATDYVYSEYGTDPEMTELVELFVADIPRKVAAFQAYTAAADWPALGTIAHQFKGAAGSYGFHRLTQPALRVERAVREQHSEQQIFESVTELLEICRMVRTGGPGAQ